MLILGVEDDGTPTGCPYQDEGALRAVLEAPVGRLRPPQKAGRVVEVDGVRLLVFEVASAARAVMVEGNGFPYRQGDAVLQVSEEFINRAKDEGLVSSPEAKMAPNGLGDLDRALIERAMDAAGFSGTPEEYLVQRRLADWRGETLTLRQAAVWLFAKSPGSIPHPNLGVRVFHVHGTEQKSGANRNVQDYPWIDHNLVVVLEQARERVDSLVRKSTKLHDLFFRETPEYPPFAWQEALVNGLAHRDYADEGRCVEVHVYEDRIEVTSPGELLPNVSLEALLNRERIHRTRNPRICRVLAELGVMRQQGEGIPRIIEDMELSWLPAPEFKVQHGLFRVVLRNSPIFEATDERWVNFVRELPLNVRQKRALVGLHDRAFQSGDYQELNRVDRDVAYRELQELEAKHLVLRNSETRGRIYTVSKSALEEATGASALQRVIATMEAAGKLTNSDFREMSGVDRSTAGRALAELVQSGHLVQQGERRGVHYVPGPNWPPTVMPKI